MISFNAYRFQSSTSFGVTPPKGMIVPKNIDDVIKAIKRNDIDPVLRAIRHTDIPIEKIEEAVSKYGSAIEKGDLEYVTSVLKKKKSGI